MSTWEQYFMMVVGWKLHPGYLKDPNYKLNIQDCAKIADEMQKETLKCLG